MAKLLDLLRPGDMRSVGATGKAVPMVLGDRGLCEELIEGLFTNEPGLRMRCAGVLEKVTAQRPEWLRPYKDVLLHQVPEIGQQEVRWHLAQMLPRLELTAAERDHARTVLTGFLSARSSILKALAMQGLADLAMRDDAMRCEVIPLIERLTLTGTPAMRARGRKLLARFARM